MFRLARPYPFWFRILMDFPVVKPLGGPSSRGLHAFRRRSTPQVFVGIPSGYGEQRQIWRETWHCGEKLRMPGWGSRGRKGFSAGFITLLVVKRFFDVFIAVFSYFIDFFHFLLICCFQGKQGFPTPSWWDGLSPGIFYQKYNFSFSKKGSCSVLLKVFFLNGGAFLTGLLDFFFLDFLKQSLTSFFSKK